MTDNKKLYKDLKGLTGSSSCNIKAVLGSCTNARYEDLQMAATILNGKKIEADTRFYVIPASIGIYRQAMSDGVLETLLDSGAIVCNPSCGPCMGGHMGVLAPGERDVFLHTNHHLTTMPAWLAPLSMKMLFFLLKYPDVIPAEAGIQVFQLILDPGFRRGDGFGNFAKDSLLRGIYFHISQGKS